LYGLQRNSSLSCLTTIAGEFHDNLIFMARRASSGISAGHIIGIAAAIAGFFVMAFLLYRIVAQGGGGSGGGYSSAVPLSVAEYLKNANSLRGNVYRVTGTIEERLKWTPDRGRLVSLDVENGATFSPVPVLIPQEFSHVNIDRGATMGFVVKVGRDGLLVAESVDSK